MQVSTEDNQASHSTKGIPITLASYVILLPIPSTLRKEGQYQGIPGEASHCHWMGLSLVVSVCDAHLTSVGVYVFYSEEVRHKSYGSLRVPKSTSKSQKAKEEEVRNKR